MEGEVLVISGFDPSGGAGTIRDLETLWKLGIKARAVVTAITAQNPRQFSRWTPVEPSMVTAQFSSAVSGITVRWVKIGMVGTRENLRLLGTLLSPLDPSPVVVLDPVLRASTGPSLFRGQPEDIIEFLDVVTVLTPNIPELRTFSREGEEPLETASRLAKQFEIPVVVKGGHLPGDPVDYIVTSQGTAKVRGRRLPGTMHGSGCAFSSALTGFLARQRITSPSLEDLHSAVEFAHNYVEEHWGY